jgi:hypothetical protein
MGLPSIRQKYAVEFSKNENWVIGKNGQNRKMSLWKGLVGVIQVFGKFFIILGNRIGYLNLWLNHTYL